MGEPHSDQSSHTVVHTARPHCQLYDLWSAGLGSSNLGYAEPFPDPRKRTSSHFRIHRVRRERGSENPPPGGVGVLIFRIPQITGTQVLALVQAQVKPAIALVREVVLACSSYS